VITDVILVWEAKMCYVMDVLMVCENRVVICMHLWCVDPSVCFLWMPNMHFKFEKPKGEYAHCSKRYELG
jgi:hypothetical protein